jgi:hypothetical protein
MNIYDGIKHSKKRALEIRITVSFFMRSTKNCHYRSIHKPSKFTAKEQKKSAQVGCMSGGN